MTLATGTPILLAVQERLSGISGQFRKGGSIDFTPRDLVISLVMIAIVGGILWLLARLLYGKERRSYNRPRALFRELCRAHGLDAASRRLLTDLARAQGVTQRAQLFLAPERFEAARLGPKLAPRAREIQALSARLFGAAPMAAQDQPSA